LSTVTYSADNLRSINTFESITGVDVRAAIIHDDEAYFVVPEDKAGMAIGKGGQTVSKVKRKLDRDIKIYEYSDNLGKFINSVVPTEIRGVDLEQDGEKVKIHVSERNKGQVVGRDGERIDTIREILSRTHGVDSVKID
jgi:N utilization substance protein A